MPNTLPSENITHITQNMFKGLQEVAFYCFSIGLLFGKVDPGPNGKLNHENVWGSGSK
jgi:hypothetical protein